MIEITAGDEIYKSARSINQMSEDLLAQIEDGKLAHALSPAYDLQAEVPRMINLLRQRIKEYGDMK